MTQPQKGLKLAEGKTKIIWENVGNSKEVLIESKDDITVGDGARHDILSDKGIFATTTTCNCFRLLESRGIPTHFIEQVDEKSFRAHGAYMIPLECVIRRVATGSYLKRQPDVKEGTRFDPLILEMFLKDDKRHDPLIIYDFIGRRELLFDAGLPLKNGFLEECPMDYRYGIGTLLYSVPWWMKEVFEILEKVWAKQNVILVDLKIEFGLDKEDGKLRIADVIDNDSWRIWHGGDKLQMKDKQIYRNSSSFDDVKKELRENYEWVAKATGKFV